MWSTLRLIKLMEVVEMSSESDGWKVVKMGSESDRCRVMEVGDVWDVVEVSDVWEDVEHIDSDKMEVVEMGSEMGTEGVWDEIIAGADQ